MQERWDLARGTQKGKAKDRKKERNTPSERTIEEGKEERLQIECSEFIDVSLRPPLKSRGESGRGEGSQHKLWSADDGGDTSQMATNNKLRKRTSASLGKKERGEGGKERRRAHDEMDDDGGGGVGGVSGAKKALDWS